MPLPPRIAKVMPQHTPKQREGMSRKHVESMHDLLCAYCGRPGPEAHHLKRGILNKGQGYRAADRWVIPLCHADHMEAHDSGNDERWLVQRGIQGRELASALWANRGDLDGMIRVLLRTLQGIIRVKETTDAA